MSSTLRYPVADAVSPVRPLVDDRPRAVNIVLHDGRRARHAVVAGPDRPGAESLIDNIATGAVAANVEVHYIGLTAPPASSVAHIAEVHAGPDRPDKPFQHWWDFVQDRRRPDKHGLVVVDDADVLLHSAGDSWDQLALFAAAINISIVLVVDRVGQHSRIRPFAADNLFHLRTTNKHDAHDASAYLPGADLQQLPLPDQHRSHGVAGSASTQPQTFAVAVNLDPS